MAVLNINSNIAEVKAAYQQFASQIPFAASQAMNDSMKDAQSYLRGYSFPAAQPWTIRNRSFSKSQTTIYKWARKTDLEVRMGSVMDRKTGRMAGEGFVQRQMSGAQKKPAGSAIAIPILGRGLKRLAGGSIPQGKKPRANPKLVKITTKRGTEILIEKQRSGKKIVPRYVLAKKARGTSPLRNLHADGFKTINATFPRRMSERLLRAVQTARPARSTGSNKVAVFLK